VWLRDCLGNWGKIYGVPPKRKCDLERTNYCDRVSWEFRRIVDDGYRSRSKRIASIASFCRKLSFIKLHEEKNKHPRSTGGHEREERWRKRDGTEAPLVTLITLKHSRERKSKREDSQERHRFQDNDNLCTGWHGYAKISEVGAMGFHWYAPYTHGV